MPSFVSSTQIPQTPFNSFPWLSMLVLFTWPYQIRLFHVLHTGVPILVTLLYYYYFIVFGNMFFPQTWIQWFSGSELYQPASYFIVCIIVFRYYTPQVFKCFHLTGVPLLRHFSRSKGFVTLIKKINFNGIFHICKWQVYFFLHLFIIFYHRNHHHHHLHHPLFGELSLSFCR